jgi:hypothetical protein
MRTIYQKYTQFLYILINLYISGIKKLLSCLWKGSQMKINYNIFMIDQLEIFKMIISLVTIIIHYMSLLALLV